MKRRIRSIFWLMVVCMVGINGFQGYWLYQTYQLTASQFARTVRDALATVVQRQQVSYARQLLQAHPGAGPKRIIFARLNDDGANFNRVLVDAAPAPGALGRARVRQEMHLTKAKAGRHATADTLARTISSLLLSDWAGARAVNLRQLGAAYHAELRLRGADAPLVLDTLRTPFAAAPRPAAPARARPAGFTLRTPPVVLNPLAGLQVQAAFQPPTFYILRQMGGLLAGSALLLALTTGCFLLMLTTILKQKKLSEVKNDFINNMTHELKTPLATVSAAVEALQNFGALHDAAKTQAYLRISRTELQRLSDLVEKC